MARRMIPTATARERGLFDKERGLEDARAAEPEAEELGAPPKYLSKKEKELWAELLDKFPPGVLTTLDQFNVEVTVGLMAEFREKRQNFNKHNQLLAALGRLGMTPTDRPKVHQDKSKVPARGFGALRRGGTAQGARPS